MHDSLDTTRYLVVAPEHWLISALTPANLIPPNKNCDCDFVEKEN